jgi:flavin reductase (DIM6/NTAB) family NADH-FMN oxidoreductase RutF
MSISWGTMGIQWGLPIFTVFVRGCRHTSVMLEENPEFTINIPLGEVDKEIIRYCGTKSGRDVDKFADFDYFTGEVTGCPAIPGTICYLEVEVDQILDLGTHNMYIGRVVGGKQLSGGEPMTYAYYRKTR